MIRKVVRDPYVGTKREDLCGKVKYLPVRRLKGIEKQDGRKINTK